MYPGAERVSPAAAGWDVSLEYRSRERRPRVAFGFSLRRAADADELLLRDVELTFSLPVDDPGDWVLNAPGNPCRSDLPLETLVEPLQIFSAADTLGSPAIVALSRRSRPETVVLWPLSETEVGEIDLQLRDGSVRTTIRTGLAARMAPGTELSWGAVYLDSVAETWPAVRSAVAGWWPPAPSASWLRQAHIYEAHVGFSVFAGGHRHERYPSVSDLRADLPRIQGLGFDVVQLMPRHPYPSYNVHDYADVTTTYGDEAELRELVADCHRRGMRVLLDLIMHGVVDKEVVDETLAAVNAGPYAQRLGDGEIDYLSRTAEDVAWSRHIVEYAPYWRDPAPDRHPLADAHPEWFMRDSAGAITRRYTKAFDVAHPGWQRYFLAACRDLAQRLGIDGFRVDAPTYNGFATWAPGRDGRAGDGPMASLRLLRELRDMGLAIYTEPAGGLFRSVADATYNYDEHWLIESLFGEPHRQRQRLVRNARELARWLHDRDAAIPAGSTIVHHIDSHDSIWWRLPGAQWRRERFGRDAAVALLAVFSLTGGAFMTFMGGEDEIEDELRRFLDLRRRLPELADGSVDYEAAVASSDDVFVVLRETADHAALVAVNLSRAEVDCDVRVDRVRVPDPVPLSLGPFQARVLRLLPYDERHTWSTCPSASRRACSTSTVC